MLRKKSFKILSVLVAVIIAFSCCCISASAKSVITNVNNFLDFLDCDLNLYKSSDGVFHNVTGAQSKTAVGNDIYYTMTCTESWGSGQWFRMSFSCGLSAISSSNMNYYGSFQIVGNSDRYNFLLDRGCLIYFTNSDGTYTYCDLSLSGSLNQILNCSFSSDGSKEPIALTIVFDFSNTVYCSAGSTVFDLSFMNLQFNQVSDSELITDNQNNNTNQIINNQNYNADRITNNQNNNTNQIINNQNSNADKITNNQNNNTNQIIGNQNANADSIKQNQNENTDKVLNGWDGSGKSPDNTKTDEYQNVEGEIDSVTADSRSASISLFNNFGNILSNLQFQKGLLAVSKLMTDLFSIDWFATIIQFALVVGSFAFILGMASFVIGRFSSSNSKGSKKKG